MLDSMTSSRAPESDTAGDASATAFSADSFPQDTQELCKAAPPPPEDELPNEEIDSQIVAAAPDQFAVRDENSANWVVRKVVEARQHAERVAAWAEREITRAKRTEERLLFLYGAQLRQWVTQELSRRRGRAKSIDLPDGKAGFRTEPERLVVDDEQALIAWAQTACPAAVMTVRRLARTAVKEYIEVTGEVPPRGVHLEPAGQRFYIR